MIGIIDCDERLRMVYSFLSASRNCLLTTNKEELKNCDIIILPVKGVDNNLIINNTNLNLTDISNNAKCIITGIMNENLTIFCKEHKIALKSYFEDELYVIENAYLTVTILNDIIHNALNSPLYDHKVLLLGYGYCGALFANMIKEEAYDLDIFTTSKLETKYLKINGFNKVNDLNHLDDYDIIINTIPYHLISDDEKKKIKADCLFFDIASKPFAFLEDKHHFSYNILSELPKRKLDEASFLLYKCIANLLKENLI